MTDNNALQSTSKKVLATGELYRNVTIYNDGRQCTIYGANEKKFDFETIGEARAFVDTWYAMQLMVSDTIKK